jgi:hypothetical protein
LRLPLLQLWADGAAQRSAGCKAEQPAAAAPRFLAASEENEEPQKSSLHININKANSLRCVDTQSNTYTYLATGSSVLPWIAGKSYVARKPNSHWIRKYLVQRNDKCIAGAQSRSDQKLESWTLDACWTTETETEVSRRFLFLSLSFFSSWPK